jgi:hypothetical protein
MIVNEKAQKARSGIELATFQFVAQGLNQLRYLVLHFKGLI